MGRGALRFGSLGLIALASGCSDSGLDCSSDGTKSLLDQIVREQAFANGELLLSWNLIPGIYDVKGATLSFSGVRTRSTTDRMVTCAATMNITAQMDPSANAERRKNGLEEVSLEPFSRDEELEYQVESTDDGGVYVSITGP